MRSNKPDTSSDDDMVRKTLGASRDPRRHC